MQSISVFLDIANLLISGGKMLMSAELKDFFCPPSLFLIREQPRKGPF